MKILPVFPQSSIRHWKISHNKKRPQKYFSLQPNNIRKWISNKPFQLLRVSLVNWLNPRLARIITVTEFPFLRDRRISIEILFGCAQIFHFSRPSVGRMKTEMKRKTKRRRPRGDMKEIVSSGNLWYGNWVAELVCHWAFEDFCRFLLRFKVSIEKVSSMLKNENFIFTRESEKHTKLP